MSRATDLDRARKVHVRRKTVRRLLSLLLVTALGLGLYLFRFDIASQGLGLMAADLIDTVFNNTGYPVELDAPPEQITRVGPRAVTLGGNLLSVYNAAGNQVVSARVSGQNPIAVPAGKRLLVYAQGGNTLSLHLGETVLYKAELDQPIYTAALSENGLCALSTGAVGYQSQVTVLDDQYQSLFEWASAESIVTALSLDRQGSVCAVGGVRSETGVLSSSLRLFELSGGIERWSVALPDELLLAVSVDADGGVTAVSDSAAHFFSSEGKELSRFDFESDLLNAFLIHPDGAVDLALGRFEALHRTRLVRLDAEGGVLARDDVELPVYKLLQSGDDLVAFSGDSAALFSPELSLLRRFETPDASSAVVIGEHLYYVTAGELCRAALR